MPFKDPERKRERNRCFYRRWKLNNPEKAKEKSRKSQEIWRLRNPNKVKEKSKKKAEQRKAIIKMWREAPCVDCGYYRDASMHFDHVPERGRKLFYIGSGTSHSCGWAKFYAERAKCDLVCAKCHEDRGHARGQFKRYLAPLPAPASPQLRLL